MSLLFKSKTFILFFVIQMHYISADFSGWFQPMGTKSVVLLNFRLGGGVQPGSSLFGCAPAWFTRFLSSSQYPDRLRDPFSLLPIAARAISPWEKRPKREAGHLCLVLIYLLTYLFTYSMEQSLSWEANRFSASQEILRVLWKLKVHYSIHTCPSHVLILSQLNPVQDDDNNKEK